MIRSRRFSALSVGLLTVSLLGGCLSSGSADSPESPVDNPATNHAPTIAGSPPSSAQIGNTYSFSPAASDPDGDTLTFSVQNLPMWASFNSATGAVTGVPEMGTEGTYNNIRVTVSDGSLSASTASFSVAVVQTSLGSATLSWNPPTTYTDGSPLNDLSAYRIYYGTSAGNYPNQIEIDNPGLTTYVVENLPPATYYFVSTAINSSGIESGYSNMATKAVN